MWGNLSAYGLRTAQAARPVLGWELRYRGSALAVWDNPIHLAGEQESESAFDAARARGAGNHA